jgi:hypothetical protein
VLGSAIPFTSLSILWKNAGPKPFCWAKPQYVLTFLHPIEGRSLSSQAPKKTQNGPKITSPSPRHKLYQFMLQEAAGFGILEQARFRGFNK